MGVTYKPDISDCRESPADPLARRLIEWGAEIEYFDPFVPTWTPIASAPELTAVPDVDAAAREADIVVLLQPHREIDLQALADASVCLLDTRGKVRGESVVTL